MCSAPDTTDLSLPIDNSRIGSSPIDWTSLGFEYRQTNGHLIMKWTEETQCWSEGEMSSDPMLPIHVSATGLHYGQAVFEGLYTTEIGASHHPPSSESRTY